MREIHNKLRAAIVTAVVGLMLVGCASLDIGPTEGKRIAVQYGTVKMVRQSGDITSPGVIEWAEKIRAVADQAETVDLTNLVSYLPLDSLSPEDQILASALLQSVRYSVEEASPGDRLATLRTALDWIIEGAKLVPNE